MVITQLKFRVTTTTIDLSIILDRESDDAIKIVKLDICAFDSMSGTSDYSIYVS